MHLVGAKPQAYACILSGTVHISSNYLLHLCVSTQITPKDSLASTMVDSITRFSSLRYIYLANFKVYIIDAEYTNQHLLRLQCSYIPKRSLVVVLR